MAAPITFAHRGASADAPENTLEAFRLGLQLGARGLESDARLSADGEVVLVHGAVAREGWRRKRVVQSTAAELAELSVPRLADLYDELGTDYELSLDVYDPAAGAVLVEVARAAGALDRLWLCSSKTELLVHAGQEGARGAPGALGAAPEGRDPARAPRGPARRARDRRGATCTAPTGPRGWSACSTASACRRSRGTRRRSATCASCWRWTSTAVYSDHVARMVATVGEFRT